MTNKTVSFKSERNTQMIINFEKINFNNGDLIHIENNILSINNKSISKIDSVTLEDLLLNLKNS